jgi:hypothetical protein
VRRSPSSHWQTVVEQTSSHALQPDKRQRKRIHTVTDTIIIWTKPKAPRWKTIVSKTSTNGGGTKEFARTSVWQGENRLHAVTGNGIVSSSRAFLPLKPFAPCVVDLEGRFFFGWGVYCRKILRHQHVSSYVKLYILIYWIPIPRPYVKCHCFLDVLN